ncbi:hypothetical protein ZHAS_00004146 [Anopheles sinensis]|uniref:Uncharacterized protein n=1 Tax=Anopheles sinensis TaxID=74873 RepID=A0A084VG81_ANOSI|nr:hypothetical protein ZHAS_00004146 [Anopheles sinensis]
MVGPPCSVRDAAVVADGKTAVTLRPVHYAVVSRNTPPFACIPVRSILRFAISQPRVGAVRCSRRYRVTWRDRGQPGAATSKEPSL